MNVCTIAKIILLNRVSLGLELGLWFSCTSATANYIFKTKNNNFISTLSCLALTCPAQPFARTTFRLRSKPFFWTIHLEAWVEKTLDLRGMYVFLN